MLLLKGLELLKMRIMGSIFCNKYFEGICIFLDLVVVVEDLVDYSVL